LGSWKEHGSSYYACNKYKDGKAPAADDSARAKVRARDGSAPVVVTEWGG
jgi:hypothetical protein